MKFMHAREYLNKGDTVIVECSHQCNIKVMNDNDFNGYKNGRSHHYHGGFYKSLPARISVPNSGFWNTTIDLAGGSANIRYNISYLKS